jgi:putative flippase GtrA
MSTAPGNPLLGQGVRMAGLTAASFALGLGLTTLLVEVAGLPAQMAYAIAIVTCTIANFFGCRYWVFRTAQMPFWPEAARFFASILLFRLAEVGVFHWLYVAIDDYRVAYVVTQVASAIVKFTIAKWFVFRAPRKHLP